MAITTASDYKTWAGISASTYDARLAVLIPYMQSRVENYCRRVFDYASFTEKVDGTGTDCIYVANAPIKTLTSVTVVYDSTSSTALDTSLYTFSTDDTGRIWLYGGARQRLGMSDTGQTLDPSWGYVNQFPVGRENITVVYAGGFGGVGATYPPALVAAFMELLAEALLTSTAAAGGTVAGSAIGLLKSKTLGQASETYRDLDDLWSRSMQRFYPWRRLLL